MRTVIGFKFNRFIAKNLKYFYGFTKKVLIDRPDGTTRQSFGRIGSLARNENSKIPVWRECKNKSILTLPPQVDI